MARALTSTRIYNDMFDLTEQVLLATESIPRCCRYTVGERMHAICMEMMRTFIMAYQSPTPYVRLRHLSDFTALLSELTFLITLARRNKFLFGTRKIGRLVAAVAGITKQVSAYKAATEKAAGNTAADVAEKAQECAGQDRAHDSNLETD
jgi:hypothetical protein